MSKILGFPSIYQSTSFSCGSASLQGVLKYYGIQTTEKVLMKLLQTSREGTDYNDIIKVAKSYNLNAEAKFLNVNQLINYLDLNVPVIINLQAWSLEKNPNYSLNTDGHYVVAIGYYEDKIIFEDPSCNGRNYLPIDELELRWHDETITGGKIDHLSIVIMKKEPKITFNKLKKMK